MILKNSNFLDAFLIEGLLSALWVLISAESMINTPRQRWCLKNHEDNTDGENYH